MKNGNFKFVGVSTLKGAIKVRFANSASRAKLLAKNGHTNIQFIELEEAAREEDCVDALLKTDWVKDEIAAAVELEAAKLGFTEFAHLLVAKEKAKTPAVDVVADAATVLASSTNDAADGGLDGANDVDTAVDTAVDTRNELTDAAYANCMA